MQWNYASDQGQSDDSRETTPYQGLVMAAKDPKTWLLTGLLYCVSTAIRGNVLDSFTNESRNRLILSAPWPTSSPALLAVSAIAAT